MPMKPILLAATLLLSASAFAQTQQTPEVHLNRPDRSPKAAPELGAGHKAHLDAMTPEERQAFREKQQARLKAMTPEERKAFREQQKARMAAMTPEERKAFMAERKKMREERMAKMTPEEREKLKHPPRPHKEGRRKKQG